MVKVLAEGMHTLVRDRVNLKQIFVERVGVVKQIFPKLVVTHHEQVSPILTGRMFMWRRSNFPGFKAHSLQNNKAGQRKVLFTLVRQVVLLHKANHV